MNWKIDWGKKYDKATYPTREKLSIPMFDIKEFVDKIKAERFQSMVGNMNDQPAFPFGGQTNNPFAGGNPFGNSNPFGNMNGQNSEIDLDEVVKRIDAKIAELEAEEAAEKDKNDWSYESDDKSNDTIEIPVDNSEKEDIKVVSEPEETKNTKDEVTDDEFFDDFWSDGE